jgi:hypothetical protein
MGGERLSAVIPVQRSMRLSAPFGVLQNDEAPMMIGDTPFFDFVHGSKAAEAGQIIVQAAISDARRLSGAVDFTH